MIFLKYLRPLFGGLAHLARALAWQARGDRFESGILHKKGSDKSEPFLVFQRPLNFQVFFS